MEKLQNSINKNFKSLWLTSSLISFSLLLLMFRIKLSKTFFLLFLVWNVFLAIIPYALTMYLSTQKQLSRFWLLMIGVLWLLFLPNAPYIITDFIHLKISNSYLWWLDILVLLSFSLTGLYLFYASLLDMQQLVREKFKAFPIQLATISILFLCAFGVYLGRFLRYNSWELLSKPSRLISDCFAITTNPTAHQEAWLFTLGFGGFLIVGYWMVKNMR